MKYKQVTLSTTTEFSELAAFAFTEAGSDGVSIKDSSDIRLAVKFGVDYIDDSLENPSDVVTVTGFFEQDFCTDELYLQLKEYSNGFSAGAMEITSSLIDSCDWENEWRKYYAPIDLGKVVIVPKWIDYNESGKVKVLLDPGMAFGTGNHETTALCLTLLQDLNLKGKRVADVGAGSGILGIAALKLGAKSCTFIDVDPVAMDACRANCALNNVLDKAEIIQGSILNDTKGEFDVLLANITADVLINLREEFSRKLAYNGDIILSGIIHARSKDVKNEFTKSFDLQNNVVRGEWQAFSGKKFSTVGNVKQ